MGKLTVFDKTAVLLQINKNGKKVSNQRKQKDV